MNDTGLTRISSYDTGEDVRGIMRLHFAKKRHDYRTAFLVSPDRRFLYFHYNRHAVKPSHFVSHPEQFSQ